MKTLTITPQQFEQLYESDMNSELPFFLKEWDDPEVVSLINIHGDGTMDYEIHGGGIYQGDWKWDGEKFSDLMFLIKLGEIIDHVNGDEISEVAEITIDAETLEELGWDFHGENDYEFFKKEFDRHEILHQDYTEEELDSYENWLKASEVHLFLRKGGHVAYLSGRKGQDWSQADAYLDTGDAEQTVKDIIELKEKGVI